MPERPHKPFAPGPLSREAAAELSRQMRETERLARLVPSAPIIGSDTASGRLLSLGEPGGTVVLPGRIQPAGPKRVRHARRNLVLTSDSIVKREDHRRGPDRTHHGRRATLGSQAGCRFSASLDMSEVDAAERTIEPGESLLIEWPEPDVDTGGFLRDGTGTPDLHFNSQNAYTPVFQGALAGGIDGTQTEIEINGEENFTIPSDEYYVILVDDEIMTALGGNSTSTWTVSRGVYFGPIYTPVASHASGTVVTLLAVPYDAYNNEALSSRVGLDVRLNYWYQYFAAGYALVEFAASSGESSARFRLRYGGYRGRHGLRDGQKVKTGSYAGTVEIRSLFQFYALAGVPQRVFIDNTGDDDIVLAEAADAVRFEMVQSRVGVVGIM